MATCYKCNPKVTTSATLRNLHTLGDRLKHERERLGWTREKMAKLGKVSRATQRLYDMSERVPPLAYLYLLAHSGANLSYLLIGDSAHANTDEYLTASKSALSKAYRLATEMMHSEEGRVFTLDDAEELFISLVEQIHNAEAPELDVPKMETASKPES